MGNISIVIGSWGSYNECNERALGSKWLDLSDYNDWEEIVEELKREGFELDGIDEELFIQDIEGIYDRSVNWDYMNPENLFNTLKDFAFNHNVISHAFSPPYFFFPTVREITFASALVLPSPRAFLYL